MCKFVLTDFGKEVMLTIFFIMIIIIFNTAVEYLMNVIFNFNIIETNFIGYFGTGIIILGILIIGTSISAVIINKIITTVKLMFTCKRK